MVATTSQPYTVTLLRWLAESSSTVAGHAGRDTITSSTRRLEPRPLLGASRLEPQKPPTAEITFAVIVPDRDILHLYLRTEKGRMRYVDAFLPHHLLNRLRFLPRLLPVALAGNQAADYALPDRDLVVVPDAWLNHIPTRDLNQRARTVGRLVHAHLLDPIQLRLAPTPDDVPF